MWRSTRGEIVCRGFMKLNDGILYKSYRTTVIFVKIARQISLNGVNDFQLSLSMFLTDYGEISQKQSPHNFAMYVRVSWKSTQRNPHSLSKIFVRFRQNPLKEMSTKRNWVTVNFTKIGAVKSVLNQANKWIYPHFPLHCPICAEVGKSDLRTMLFDIPEFH